MERPALNGALAGVTIKWQDNISGETFALRRTNTRVVRHGETRPFHRDSNPFRCGASAAQWRRGRQEIWRWECGSCMQWGVCQGTRDKAVITHNEESRVHADTNAVRGETRDRALVTTVTQGIMGTKWNNFSPGRRRTAMKWMFPLTKHRTMANISVWPDHVRVKASRFHQNEEKAPEWWIYTFSWDQADNITTSSNCRRDSKNCASNKSNEASSELCKVGSSDNWADF